MHAEHPELQISFTGPRDVIVPGQEISPHIIRLNMIILEVFGDEDDITCAHCFSTDITETQEVDHEYNACSAPYVEINPMGSNWMASSYQMRRDKVEKRHICNFCDHVLSLGWKWSDWYKVPIINSGTIEKTVWTFPETKVDWDGHYTLLNNGDLTIGNVDVNYRGTTSEVTTCDSTGYKEQTLTNWNINGRGVNYR